MLMCIPKERFLSGKCLVYEDGDYYWTNIEPKNSLILGCPNRPLSLERVFQILDEKVPEIIEDRVAKSYKSLGVRLEEIPVDAVQSSAAAISRIKKAFIEAERVVSALDSDGYMETYIKCNQTLDSVKCARFNVKKFHSDLKNGKIKNATVAKTFRANKAGYIQRAEYSTTKTITGRMTVSSGPQILTAPKYYRDYIESSYPGGKIIQLDFISLEPRVSIHAKNPESERDIYEFLMSSIFSEKVSRSLMKKIVLCSMYGASEKTIKGEIPDGYSAKTVIEKTREFLNFKDIVSEQRDNIHKFGFIKNYFGRPVYPQDSRDAVVFNNYVQSSAVDVSLLGFREILKSISEMQINPLFFIHDALIFDVHPGSFEKFKQMSKSVEIDGLGKFPLEISILSDN